HPLEIGLVPVLRHEIGAAFADRGDRRLRQGLRIDVPLISQERLNGNAPTVAMRNHMAVRLDPGEKTALLHDRNDLLARLEAVSTIELLPERLLFRSRRQAFEEILVFRECDLGLGRQNADGAQAVALANLKVVEVMRRSDLHGARTLL